VVVVGEVQITHQEVLVLVEATVVPVLSSSLILHKYTQGYIPINNKNIYSL
jgi:hypothetical protein